MNPFPALRTLRLSVNLKSKSRKEAIRQPTAAKKKIRQFKYCDSYIVVFFHPKPLKGLIPNEMG